MPKRTMLGNLSVKIVPAIDHYDVVYEFYKKHISILKNYGVKGVSSAKPKWKYTPNVYVVVVYDNSSGEMVGGMRLEISSEGHTLPFEVALRGKVMAIDKYVRSCRKIGGACEFAGLWVDPKYRKMEIPVHLTELGIGLARQLGIKYAFAFANDYSRPITEKLGFVSQKIDGQQIFPYPDERYPTRLMRKDCTVEHQEITLRLAS